MDVGHESGLSIEFEAGTLSVATPSPAPAKAPPSRKYRIGWFIQSTDVNSASTRYRCFHFARALRPRFDSRYLTSLSEVQDALPRLDALIIVKRLDRAVLDVVGMARTHGVPTFLDLCDDLISPAYFKNDFGVNLMHFLGIAPFLSGVTVSSAEMADRVESYAADNGGASVPVHVVPDVAETWEIFRATHKAVTGQNPNGAVEAPAEQASARPKQVLWFGNFGASHSNFGQFGLRPFLKQLEAVHADIPLELVVVSNSEKVFEALVNKRSFASRYVPWTATATYTELARADVALLTTGDDEFCSIKSSNRVLQALAAGVPVITAKSPAISEFEDAVFTGSVEAALRTCLGRRGERVVRDRLATAQGPLARYSPEILATIWAGLLTGAIEKREGRAALAADRRVLFVVEPGDRPENVKAAVFAAKGMANLDYELLMSIEAQEKDPALDPILMVPRRLPRFYSGKLKGLRNLLLNCSAIVIDRPGAPIAKSLAAQAKQLGVRVLTTDEAAGGALKPFARKRALPIASSSIVAGPYQERTDADGSVDWAFVVHQNARGWILDAICREIGSRQRGSWKVFYHPEVSGDARNLFFSHYMLLENYLDRHSDKVDAARTFVWYTHPREETPRSIAKQLLAFERVTKVIFACESNRQVWVARGLAENKTAVVLGAADPELFRFHQRGNGVIGLSSSFYERKNPDCLLQLVKLLPHRQFVLLGRKWNQYARFEEMRAQPNFTYLSLPYRDHPDVHATFDVFLSMSSIEGGPIPLIEAMMSNAVPVASRTGFAPDLIQHGENGFLFDLDAPPQAIADMIELAFALPADVRATVEQYDWEHFSAAITRLAD
jgi:glycosyltransferase involved in cell wall biosynthesis